jgi:hypothetical protein
MTLLSTRTIASLKRLTLRAFAQSGLTIGGASWRVEAVSGGIRSTASETLGTAYEGYTEQVVKTREAQAQAGAYYDVQWKHTQTGDSVPTLAPGTVIAGASVRFRIVGPILDPVWPGRVWACEQVQGA